MNSAWFTGPRRLQERAAVILGLALLTAPLLAYAVTGSFARYMADDFCTALELSRRGFLGSQVYWYTRWTGRFSFTAAVNLAELLGQNSTRFGTTATLAIWFLAWTWAAYQLTRLTQLRRPLLAAATIALTGLVAFCGSLPNIGQVLYWQTGILTYVAPLIGLTVIIGLLAQLARTAPSTRMRRFAFAVPVAALAFVAAGCSDTYAALQVTVFAAAAAALLALPRELRRDLTPSVVTGLLAALIALAFVIAAPGNARREAYFPPHPGLGGLVVGTTIHTLGFLDYWLTTHTVSVLLALVVPGLLAFLLSQPATAAGVGRDEAVASRLLVALVGLAFLLTAACFAPAAWALSSAPPERTLSVPLFPLVCLAAGWGYTVGRRANAHRTTLALAPSLLLAAAMLIGALLLFTSVRDAAKAVAALRGYRQYALQWDARDAELRAAREAGAKSAVVAPLSRVMGLDEVDDKPGHPVNYCVSHYYGLESIVAR